MGHPDPRVRASRALVIAAALLMITGFLGLGHSIVRLSGEPAAAPVSQILPGAASITVREASEAYHASMERIAAETPHRRVLDVANLLLSGMLLVASTQLLLLRRSGPWWVTQAVVANIAWTLTFAAAHIYQLLRHAEELRGRLRTLSEAMRADPQVPGGELPFDELALAIGARVAVAVLAVALYAWIAWRMRRQDVDVVLAEVEQNRRRD